MNNPEDSRLYHRFTVNQPELCYATQNGIRLGFVTEISYGGFSLALNRSPNTPIKNPSSVELHFLDKSVSCEIEERYAKNNRAGYQLKHEHTAVLTFLKEIIPWLRAGAALSYLQKLERDGFEGELPEHLNFEGPIPIEIEWIGVDSQKSPNFSMTFTQDKVVYQLIKNNENIETLHNVWPGGESGEMRSTSSLDSTIVRNALAILIGLSNYSETTSYTHLAKTVLLLYERTIVNSVKHSIKAAG